MEARFKNPEFMEKVMSAYDKESKPVPGTKLIYSGRNKDGRLKFRNAGKVQACISLELIDFGKSCSDEGMRIDTPWSWDHSRGQPYASILIRALVAQFPDP